MLHCQWLAFAESLPSLTVLVYRIFAWLGICLRAISLHVVACFPKVRVCWWYIDYPSLCSPDRSRYPEFGNQAPVPSSGEGTCCLVVWGMLHLACKDGWLFFLFRCVLACVVFTTGSLVCSSHSSSYIVASIFKESACHCLWSYIFFLCARHSFVE